MLLHRTTLGGAQRSKGKSLFQVGIMSQKQIYYSDKYDDEKFEYRHVMLPKDIAKRVPKTHLMSETEWRNLGVQQSQGWIHYMIHQPEPHILLFRRPLPAA
ncbi:cyclin-dependent kinases regulatory subunit 1 isoform X1 [Oncorhynchus masou masou]|uniref:cyclin-dependent kinases regulatory subunit 1 isoform X1 n=1 Tax=Oncorhynchus masou masou TaxID=90313 RepID=UPI0031835D33